MRKLVLTLALLGAMLAAGCNKQSSEVAPATSMSKPPPVIYADP